MLGAIVLAYQKNDFYIKQNVMTQLNVKKKDLIKLNDINPNN